MLAEVALSGKGLVSLPSAEEGIRTPGTHCSHMHIIIAKATWQN